MNLVEELKAQNDKLKKLLDDPHPAKFEWGEQVVQIIDEMNRLVTTPKERVH